MKEAPYLAVSLSLVLLKVEIQLVTLKLIN